MGKLYGEAEKFIDDIFWAESHDSSNTLNIPDTIADKIEKDNIEKDPDYYNHRPGVIHVSSLGKCLRGVVHEMLGAEKDVKDSESVKRKLGVFKAGNLFEDFIVGSLGDLMLDRQTEYVYSYKGAILTGRDDGTMNVNGQRRMLECKSVHSDSFWHRKNEGKLVAYQNQMQIQTYLWLRRILPNVFVRQHYGSGEIYEIIYTNLTKQALWEHRGMRPDDKLIPVEKPDNSNLNGIFAYVSKDDCSIEQAPVRFNMRIIDETVLPALDAVIEAYVAKNPDLLPLPPLAIYDSSRGQWKKNWLCTYCDYHSKCAGAGWVLEAGNEVARLNKEQAQSMGGDHLIKKDKPVISVASVEVKSNRSVIGVDTSSGVDGSAMFTAHRDGDSIIIDTVETTPPPNETTLQRVTREMREKGIINPKSTGL